LVDSVYHPTLEECLHLGTKAPAARVEKYSLPRAYYLIQFWVCSLTEIIKNIAPALANAAGALPQALMKHCNNFERSS